MWGSKRSPTSCSRNISETRRDVADIEVNRSLRNKTKIFILLWVSLSLSLLSYLLSFFFSFLLPLFSAICYDLSLFSDHTGRISRRYRAYIYVKKKRADTYIVVYYRVECWMISFWSSRWRSRCKRNNLSACFQRNRLQILKERMKLANERWFLFYQLIGFLYSMKVTLQVFRRWLSGCKIFVQIIIKLNNYVSTYFTNDQLSVNVRWYCCPLTRMEELLIIVKLSYRPKQR